MLNYTPSTIQNPVQSLENYRNYFLASALQLNWATETITFPRLRNTTGQRQIYPKNLNEEIDQGHKHEVQFGRMKQPMTLPLERFKWTKLRHHVRIKTDAKTTREWIFLNYPDDALVDFFILDPDLHPITKPSLCTELVVDPTKTGMTPEDWAEVESEFEDHVAQIRDLIPDNCITWTTSPGDIYDGKHRQGMYAVVKLSEAIPVDELRAKLKTWKAYHDLEVEDCWDSKHKNVRLPGQMWVEVCDPDTQKILEPWEKPQDTLSTFCKHFDEAEVLDIAHLDVPTENSHFLPPKKALTSTLSPPKIQSGYIPSRLFNEDYFERSRHKNHWKALQGTKMFSRMAWKYRGDKSRLSEAVSEISSEFRLFCDSISGNSEVDQWRDNPTPFLFRVMFRYLDKFDPRLSNGGYRAHRDSERRGRIAFARGIDRQHLLRQAKAQCGLSYNELQLLDILFSYWDKLDGSLASKLLYGRPKSIFSSAYKWFQFRDKIKPLFETVDEYSKREHKCRQWCWTINVVKKCNDLSRAGIVANEIIKRQRESKEYVELCTYAKPRTSRSSASATSLIDSLNGHSLDYDDKILLN